MKFISKFFVYSENILGSSYQICIKHSIITTNNYHTVTFTLHYKSTETFNRVYRFLSLYIFYSKFESINLKK